MTQFVWPWILTFFNGFGFCTGSKCVCACGRDQSWFRFIFSQPFDPEKFISNASPTEQRLRESEGKKGNYEREMEVGSMQMLHKKLLFRKLIHLQFSNTKFRKVETKKVEYFREKRSLIQWLGKHWRWRGKFFAFEQRDKNEFVCTLWICIAKRCEASKHSIRFVSFLSLGIARNAKLTKEGKICTNPYRRIVSVLRLAACVFLFYFVSRALASFSLNIRTDIAMERKRMKSEHDYFSFPILANIQNRIKTKEENIHLFYGRDSRARSPFFFMHRWRCWMSCTMIVQTIYLKRIFMVVLNGAFSFFLCAPLAIFSLFVSNALCVRVYWMLSRCGNADIASLKWFLLFFSYFSFENRKLIKRLIYVGRLL